MLSEVPSLSEFALYLRVGFHHIVALGAWDHILFVAALTAAYGPHEWKRVAWLITGFTVGHSITLALATFDVVRPSAKLVEPLIALTIVATAAFAVRNQIVAPATRGEERTAWRGRFGIACGFGLVHGLGFASGLRAILGAEQSVTVPLLGFNVGIEAGQLLIVSAIFALGVVALRWLGVSRRSWVLTIGMAAGAAGLTLLLTRLVAMVGD